MRKISIIFAVALLSGGVSFADVITISTDAHVRSGSNGDINYGAGTRLWARESANANDRLKIYVEVEVDSIMGAGELFSEATLNLKASSTQASATTFSLYGIVNNSDSWTEGGVA